MLLDLSARNNVLRCHWLGFTHSKTLGGKRAGRDGETIRARGRPGSLMSRQPEMATVRAGAQLRDHRRVLNESVSLGCEPHCWNGAMMRLDADRSAWRDRGQASASARNLTH